MKLYKNTLITCICIFAGCLLLSILFKFTCLGEMDLFLFLTDYMIGIACSIIVVLITTYVQFKFEQRKILNSILTNIQFFYFRYRLVVMSIDPKEQVPPKLWEHYYDSLQDDIKKITSKINEIEWFSKKKEKTITELSRSFLKLLIAMSKVLDTQRERAVKGIVGDPILKNIRDSALSLAGANNRAGEEIAENYEKAEACLEELKKNGCWTNKKSEDTLM